MILFCHLINIDMAAFDMSKIHLDDLEFFCDERLDKINVYSVVLVSNFVDFDLIITDFCLRMKNVSCVQMIQEISGGLARFSFVSHVACSTFSKCLHSIVHILSSYYKCKISLL